MKTDACGTAVIGMACRFPGAPDLETFRTNLERGYDAISVVPQGRWDALFYDPASDATDRIYCRRGGFIGSEIDFDAVSYGIMPVAALGAEPDQMLALDLVSQALEDAGLTLDSELPRAKTAVIFGRGGYPGRANITAIHHSRYVQQTIETLRGLVPGVSEQELSRVSAELKEQAGHYGGDTTIGLVPNLAASRIANRFDFLGSAYTVDAACASSLVAVENAIRELHSGTADLVVTGGMYLSDDLLSWNIFSRLGALSRGQQIRPFDRRADGLLIGEGFGILILKRLADARRDGNRIYAVIKGAGVASDGRGKSLMNPNVDGQLLAFERGWGDARLDPSDIGLLEAHGTGTPTGDAVELTTIARFFGPRLKHVPSLGSVKSMIGHAMPAAGAAGLIKAILALYHRFLPPTLHCEEPNELVEETGFRIQQETDCWDPAKLPLRAAVNAFGFGGINAHVVLEAGDAEPRKRAHALLRPEIPEIRLVAADDAEGLLAALEAGHGGSPQGIQRLAVENPSPERRELARTILARGRPWHGRKGIWYAPEGMVRKGWRIAFLYPGVDGLFNPRIGDIGDYMGRELPRYHDARGDLLTESIGIIGLGRWLTDILDDIGIKPDAVAGHSIGEWTAMLVSGISAAEEADRFVEEVIPSLQFKAPGVGFAAAGCGIDKARSALAGLERIAVSHDNCPHQVILCGIDESIDIVVERLRSHGVVTEKLPFRSGFHSPLFEEFVAPLWEHFADFSVSAPTVPIWSATTVSTYPEDPASLRQLFVDHLVRPVRFRELIKRLYDEGCRIFIQLGTGRLVGFVDDILSEREHAAVSAQADRIPGMQQLRRLAAGLWCEGADVRLKQVGLQFDPESAAKRPAKGIKLALAAPLVRPTQPLDLPRVPGAPFLPLAAGTEAKSVLREFLRVQADIAAMSEEVVEAWQKQSATQPPSLALTPRKLARTRHYSLDEFSDLVDHCFARLPEDWPHARDRFPVVPLTSSLQTMLELASELVPERIPIGLERIRANRWLEVEPPVEVELRAEFDGVDRVRIELGDKITGTVVLGTDYPPAPTPHSVNSGPVEVPGMDGETFYRERWMFHGPAYQGVVKVGPAGRGGLLGEIKRTRGHGSLIDSAGQLAGGYLAAVFFEEARSVAPYRIDRIEFFGAEPPVGTHMQCSVHVLELTDVRVRADQDIYQNGKVWARVVGREDRRVELNTRLRTAFAFPENNAYGEMQPGGYCLVKETWRTAATRYMVARGYLNGDEHADFAEKKVKSQRSWLLGRMAAKDAVRQVLWRRGAGDLYPHQIRVTNDESGRALISGPWNEDLRVSVAHKETVAAAIIAEGADVGIDIEKIEPRDEGFVRMAFAPEELALLPSVERDLWLTRLWVAKEAVSKFDGTGLQGDPRRYRLGEFEGERLRVNDMWVATRREGDYMVGWTDHLAICDPTL